MDAPTCHECGGTMGKRLTDEERQRRTEEKARKKREREAQKEAKRKAKEEEKARKKREREAQKRQKEIERGQKMKRKPKWLYWLIREQDAKRREHEQYMNAGRTALTLARAIRKAQQKIMAFIGPLINYAAKLKTPQARLIWSHEPWTPQQRTRYNWGKKQELDALWTLFPDGVAEQDPEAAARDARRKTKARQIDHAKAIDSVLEKVAQELAEDKQNAVTSSLERSYRQVYADIVHELENGRQAIDADKANATRMADARDYTANGNPRRTAPETQIPRNMPRLGNYGQSVIFGAPSPDQVKAVLNAEFEGKDYSARIWKDRDKLASDLKDMMQAAIINGDNSDNVAQKLAQRMGVEFSHAQRLVRTEMNRILNQATLDGIKQAGGSTYEFLAIEDSRTCKRCQKLNHKRFKLKDKKVGLNFPPIHPRCRCTIMARFEWEDEDDDKPTAPTAPPTPTAPTASTRGTQQTIEGWLNRIEAIDKAKADNLRNEPTQANAQAAVAAQDAAMKQAEAIQQNAIGIQQRAILQGKAVISEDKKGKSERPKDIPTEADFKNSKRFGHKAGKHMQELDLDPKSQEEREKYKSIINDTIKFATKIKRGFYTREEPDVLCYQKDDMVVLLRTNGAIVTAYTQKSSIKDHPALESREWYNNMKIIFESSD